METMKESSELKYSWSIRKINKTDLTVFLYIKKKITVVKHGLSGHMILIEVSHTK